jgi:hypothetical protein
MKNTIIVFFFLLSISNYAQDNLNDKKTELEKRRALLVEAKNGIKNVNPEVQSIDIEKKKIERIEKRAQLLEEKKEAIQERKERIKSLKIAFISQKLSLTSVEAEKFWPIYNKYDEKIMVLKEAQMKLRIQKRIGTDEEALKKIEEAEEKEAEVMTLKKKLRAELIPVISAEKVLKLEQLEQEFHRKLLEKLQDRRGNRPPPRR